MMRRAARTRVLRDFPTNDLVNRVAVCFPETPGLGLDFRKGGELSPSAPQSQYLLVIGSIEQCAAR